MSKHSEFGINRLNETLLRMLALNDSKITSTLQTLFVLWEAEAAELEASREKKE